MYGGLVMQDTVANPHHRFTQPTFHLTHVPPPRPPSHPHPRSHRRPLPSTTPLPPIPFRRRY